MCHSNFSTCFFTSWLCFFAPHPLPGLQELSSCHRSPAQQRFQAPCSTRRPHGNPPTATPQEYQPLEHPEGSKHDDFSPWIIRVLFGGISQYGAAILKLLLFHTETCKSSLGCLNVSQNFSCNLRFLEWPNGKCREPRFIVTKQIDFTSRSGLQLIMPPELFETPSNHPTFITFRRMPLKTNHLLPKGCHLH